MCEWVESTVCLYAMMTKCLQSWNNIFLCEWVFAKEMMFYSVYEQMVSRAKLSRFSSKRMTCSHNSWDLKQRLLRANISSSHIIFLLHTLQEVILWPWTFVFTASMFDGISVLFIRNEKNEMKWKKFRREKLVIYSFCLKLLYLCSNSRNYPKCACIVHSGGVIL